MEQFKWLYWIDWWVQEHRKYLKYLRLDMTHWRMFRISQAGCWCFRHQSCFHYVGCCWVGWGNVEEGHVPELPQGWRHDKADLVFGPQQEGVPSHMSLLTSYYHLTTPPVKILFCILNNCVKFHTLLKPTEELITGRQYPSLTSICFLL